MESAIALLAAVLFAMIWAFFQIALKINSPRTRPLRRSVGGGLQRPTMELPQIRVKSASHPPPPAWSQQGPDWSQRGQDWSQQQGWTQRPVADSRDSAPPEWAAAVWSRAD
jgi:hypothetical protein